MQPLNKLSFICDISSAGLVDDPLGTVRRIYEFLGEELSPLAEQRMAEWLSISRERPVGGWKHHPEMVGLKREAIQTAFADYLRQYPEAVADR